MKRQIGDSVVSMILLLSAFTGSDTTSRILGVGKGMLLKLNEKIDYSIPEVFYKPNSTKAAVLKMVERECFQFF